MLMIRVELFLLQCALQFPLSSSSCSASVQL
uniref:Uncharacterized protein n=1 Tax=Rhizophora mucronata TaxID=61149 RepID=A0A2P2NS47_RHIMU